MRKVHVAVQLQDQNGFDPDRHLDLVLAERYGDDPLLAHGWIEYRLWTDGVVALEDDQGHTWRFELADLRCFAVRAH